MSVAPLPLPRTIDRGPIVSTVCAVVVTFHPGPEIESNLAALAPHVDRILVVDNASGPDDRTLLRRLADAGRIELLENPANLGIAAALNRGAERAEELGYRWLLTLDQDTKPMAGMFAGLRAAYRACSFRDQLGLIAANFVDPALGVPFAPIPEAGPGYVERATAITSGSLIRLTAYRDAGPFRDDFFIDFVDNEYSFRLRCRGYRLIYTDRPLIEHAIGQPKRHRLLWMRPASSNHPPLRRYYMTRNRLVTDWIWFTREPRAVVADYYRLMGEAFLLCMFEDRKWQKIHAMILGAWHAVSGRMGQLSSPPWPG